MVFLLTTCFIVPAMKCFIINTYIKTLKIRTILTRNILVEMYHKLYKK